MKLLLRNMYPLILNPLLSLSLFSLSRTHAHTQASTAALIEFPAVNGVIDESTNEIVYRHFVDISIAVASPTGTWKLDFLDTITSAGISILIYTIFA